MTAPSAPPLLRIHGALFSAWTLLLLTQALFVTKGRKASHRAFVIVPVSAICLFAGFMIAAIARLHRGTGPDPRAADRRGRGLRRAHPRQTPSGLAHIAG